MCAFQLLPVTHPALPWWKQLSLPLSLAARDTGILYFHCVVLIVKTKKKEHLVFQVLHMKSWGGAEGWRWQQWQWQGGVGGVGDAVVLISELPWRAAIAVRCYERSFAKVRQIPPHSVLIGLSDLQNREGMQGAWAQSSLQDCRTEATSWHMQQRPLSETHRPTQRAHDRLHRNASTGSEAAVTEVENSPEARNL